MRRKSHGLSLLLYLSIAFLLSSTAFAFKLPVTGQTKCYQGVSPYDDIPCAGTRQDGAYTINPMSFTDNGNGTVTDYSTALMWQKCSVGQNNDATCNGDALTYNWYQANGAYDPSLNPSSQDVCGSLVLGGHSDWRLPTKKDLMSIVDYSIPFPGPTIKTVVFPNTMSYYSSSTTYASDPSRAWGGYLSDGQFGLYLKSSLSYIRCVRRGPLGYGDFTDNVNDTVTDNATGVMWQQGEAGSMPWQAALDYCNGLDLANKRNWRLPNIKELESLTDDTRYNPAIDTNYFPNAHASYYWSSTTYASDPSRAWGGYFSDGRVHSPTKDDGRYVRCVRGPTPDPPVFADVPYGHWAKDHIEVMYSHNITGGCSTNPLNYCPDSPVTRDQMAAFIVRAKDGGDPQGTCTAAPFLDVPTNHWACKNIERFTTLGITGGCGGGYFCPDNEVTREQMAAFIIRAVEGEPTGSCTVQTFNDVPISSLFCKHIERMAALGITGGCGNGNYCPKNTVTRDLMAVFLARAFLGMP